MLGVGLLLVSATATFVLRTPHYQKRREPQALVIPPAAEVSELRIHLSAHCFGFKPIANLVVPREHVSAILGWLRPSEHIREPWRLDQLVGGEAIIKTRDGKEMSVRFYDAGVNPAVLTANGVDQFYGPDFQGETRYGAIGFADAIRAAYHESRRQGNRD